MESQPVTHTEWPTSTFCICHSPPTHSNRNTAHIHVSPRAVKTHKQTQMSSVVLFLSPLLSCFQADTFMQRLSFCKCCDCFSADLGKKQLLILSRIPETPFQNCLTVGCIPAKRELKQSASKSLKINQAPYKEYDILMNYNLKARFYRDNVLLSSYLKHTLEINDLSSEVHSMMESKLVCLPLCYLAWL